MFLNESSIGNAYYHPKTKKLLEYIPANSIAILNHKDIDRVSAERLLEKRVQAVVNCNVSFSGQYLSQGTRMLIEQEVPVCDLGSPSAFLRLFQNGDQIELTGTTVNLLKKTNTIQFEIMRSYTIGELYKAENELRKQGIIDKNTLDFIDNTLFYAQMERRFLEEKVELPTALNALRNRSAVIVTRGYQALKELKQLQEILLKLNPFIIAVDGGADIVQSAGFQPDVIFGDMDSVSEQALHSGASLVVHAYTNRKAPGAQTLNQAKLSYELFPCFGTSEDAAIMMAYYGGAKRIISVGSHKHILDYQEKDRQGMGSTLLTRMLVGDRLIDARDFVELVTLRDELKGRVPVIASLNRTFKRTWAQVLENGPY